MDGKQLLMKHFGIKAEKVSFHTEGPWYESDGLLYHIVDVTKKEQQYLYELHQMSQHLIRQGEKRTAVFLPNQKGRFLIEEEKKEYTVLISKRYAPPSAFSGRQLAHFHLRGQSLSFEVKSASEWGGWTAAWEKRLEKLEKVVGGAMREQDDSFIRLVAESFPYYMGLTENALQYAADTEIDETPGVWDAGTVCQRTFDEKAWINEPAVHQPFNWVFDHPARDIAEWIRSNYWQGSLFYRGRFAEFIQQYEQIKPISPFAWRLIYARLLFPVHYFECTESCFSASSFHFKKEDEEKLKRYTAYSHEYEQFLGFFFEQISGPAQQLNLPAVDWLK